MNSFRTRSGLVCLVVAAGVVACSGTTTGNEAPAHAPVVGSGHGTCVARKGTYSAIYLVRDGDCGSISERIEVVDQTAPPVDAGAMDAGAPRCTATVTQTVDNCEVTYASRCPSDGIEKGGALAITGLSKWMLDGTYGTAIEQWVATGAAGNTLCTGTYTVAIRKE